MPTIKPEEMKKCYTEQELLEQQTEYCEQCVKSTILFTHLVTIREVNTDEILIQYKEFTCERGHPNGQVGVTKLSINRE